MYDTQSGQYFQSPEGWTNDPAQALDLESNVQAVNVAFQQRLRGVEIVFAFDDANLRDMRLPLHAGG